MKFEVIFYKGFSQVQYKIYLENIMYKMQKKVNLNIFLLLPKLITVSKQYILLK